jgi:MFS family permease
MKRLAVASLIGTTLEYYDFAVYNTLAALVFNRVFFPSFDPLSGTILAFSTFAVGYLSRPAGGLLFGSLGDRHGRRFVLVATLIAMGITTALMGLLPTYANVGVMAPVLLVALRFIQGAALGGEWAGSVLLAVEHGSPERRGLNGAWTQMGPSIGTLLASGTIAALTASMSADAFVDWGWRLAFFASVALVVFGVWVRRGVDETPLFEKLKREHSIAPAPVKEVLRDHWRSVVVGIGVRLGSDVMYSLLAVFTLTYLTNSLGLSRTFALVALCLGSLFHAVSMPFFGVLSDRLGRRRVYAFGAAAAFLLLTVWFPLLDTKSVPVILLAFCVGFALHASMYGPQAALLTEQFPTRLRYCGASLAYTFAGILGGGIAPLVFASLLKAYESTLAIVLYASCALALTALALTRAHRADVCVQ